tara:strand:- start:62 stop:430 length:369 start_codon:yes stop_codon:yes gene_type:complete
LANVRLKSNNKLGVQQLLRDVNKPYAPNNSGNNSRNDDQQSEKKYGIQMDLSSSPIESEDSLHSCMESNYNSFEMEVMKHTSDAKDATKVYHPNSLIRAVKDKSAIKAKGVFCKCLSNDRSI